MKTVRLEDFSRELGELTAAQIQDLKVITYRGLLAAIPELVEASPVDIGQYASSWAVEWDGGEVMSIGNYAPHAAIIEYGARPFTPPIAPLLEWARRVIQIEGGQDASKVKGPPKDENGRAVSGPTSGPTDPSMYSPQVRALAYAVQAKIRQVGIKPRHVLETMIPTIIQKIVEEFRRGPQTNE